MIPTPPPTIDPADVALCVSDQGVEERSDPPAGSAPTSVPIVQTSLFTFPSFGALVEGLSAEDRAHVYTRGQNPTVEALERKLARLERGEACKAFASGMAAISAVLLGVLEAGDHVLFVNHTYGPTLELAAHLRRFGIAHDTVLDLAPHAVRAALRPETRLVWIESPGTMLFRLVDVAAVSAIARDHGALTCLDNSWATPLFQKPIDKGADIVVHSATKYIGGHSDVVAGAVVTRSDLMERIFYRAYLLNGGILAPFDSWLLLRGLRTLPVRMRQHHDDGLRVARFLAAHPAVRRVHHPALEEPERAAAELRGFAGLLSFELESRDHDSVARVIDRLRRFRPGVSWGGVESLVISPDRPGNDAALREAGIPRGLIRLSVGLEGADALIADLDAALGARST